MVAKLHGSPILAVVHKNGLFLNDLARGDLHDVDGISDHIGGTLVALGCLWHTYR